MRIVPGPTGGKTRSFIPSAFGNRADPEPITIEILQPTEAERRELSSSADASFELDANKKLVKDANGHVRIQIGVGDTFAQWRSLLERFVVSVKNYKAAGGALILTGKDLYAHGETDLVSEVASEILGDADLSEREKKLSGAPSACSGPVTPASNGTAVNAAIEATTSPAAAG